MAKEEREAQERRETIAAKKQRKAERRKAQQQRRKQSKGGGGGAGRGTLVEEFASGKKEIWMMLGAHPPEESKLHDQEDRSHDQEVRSHDQLNDNGQDGEEFDLPLHRVSVYLASHR